MQNGAKLDLMQIQKFVWQLHFQLASALSRVRPADGGVVVVYVVYVPG